MRLLLASAVALFCLAALSACFVEGKNIAADRIYSLPNIGKNFKSDHYSGYLKTLGGRQTFYYFAESERDPANDPLVLWLNGGPGCSSLLGLFTENGPFLLRHDGLFYNNPYSWTREANVLWMESPPGVGFSVDNCDIQGECTYWNDAIVAELNYESLGAFVDAFPKFKNHSLYLTGESYAGHYVPQLSQKILHGNNTDLKSMMKGFMVGNPCTGNYNGSMTDLCWMSDDPTLELFYKYHAFLSFDDKINVNLTDQWGFVDINPGYDIYDIAVRYCQADMESKVAEKLGAKTNNHGKIGSTKPKHYFLADTDPEEGDPKARYGPCNNDWLQDWLNRLDVQAALHAQIGTVWRMWAPDASFNYTLPQDEKSQGVLPVYRDIIQNSDWDILVYSGDMDSRVNFIQTQKIIEYIALSYPVGAQPIGAFRPWHYQDIYNSSWQQIGGFYQKYTDRLSWASVKGAGHMVPTNKPAPALQLLKTFIADGAPGAAPVLGIPEPNSTTAVPPPITIGTVKTADRQPDVVYVDNSKHQDIGFFVGGIFAGLFLGIVIACLWHRREVNKMGRRTALNEDYTAELAKEAH